MAENYEIQIDKRAKNVLVSQYSNTGKLVTETNVNLPDPERGLTLRAPETATRDALLQDLIDIFENYHTFSIDEHKDIDRALRERLFW